MFLEVKDHIRFLSSRMVFSNTGAVEVRLFDNDGLHNSELFYRGKEFLMRSFEGEEVAGNLAHSKNWITKAIEVTILHEKPVGVKTDQELYEKHVQPYVIHNPRPVIIPNTEVGGYLDPTLVDPDKFSDGVAALLDEAGLKLPFSKKVVLIRSIADLI